MENGTTLTAIRNAPAVLRDLERVANKSLACSLLDAHTACTYLRRGIVEHDHTRKDTRGITYMLRSAECPTCACQCPCHIRRIGGVN